MASHEPTRQRTIETAEALPSRSTWLAAGTTAGLTWAAFFPLDWGFVAWIAPVPILLLVRQSLRPSHLYRALYTCSFLGFLASLQWMRLGDNWMIPAWICLSLYLAAYLPVQVAACRVAHHRLRVPLGVIVPAAFVAGEYARAHLLTGLAWYFLGHSQHRFVELIQISDLVGAYGVTAIVMLVATAITVSVPTAWLARLAITEQSMTPAHLPSAATSRAGWMSGPGPRTTLAAIVLVALAVSYGIWRRGQVTFEPGPRVALIQGNFTSSLKHDPEAYSNIYQVHRRLTGLAVRQQPDLVVWPETMFRYPLLEVADGLDDEQLRNVAPGIPPEEWRKGEVQTLLQDLAAEAGAGLVVGLERIHADKSHMQVFNSAVLIHPESGITSDYDKMHRVPFGEYIPLSDTLPWLHKLTPFPAHFGITRGSSASIFRHGHWRMAPLICFEDTVPHLVRGIVSSAASQQRAPDVLVNLTNDGWFHGSSELDQHLVTAAFRAIECRTPMVRAVNTGISAIIDGDGVIRTPETFVDGDAEIAIETAKFDPSLDDQQREERIRHIEMHRRQGLVDPMTGRWRRQLNAVLVDNVPLDPRQSLYVKTGDLFSLICTLATLATLISPLLSRKTRGQTEGQTGVRA